MFSIGKQLGASFVSLDELLNRSDFVIVSCPLNDETKNLFDKSAFGKMKKTAVFVNVARGGNENESKKSTLICSLQTIIFILCVCVRVCCRYCRSG